MKIYVDYNLLERLVDALEGATLKTAGNDWAEDHGVLPRIWESFLSKKISLITCEADCLAEFINVKPCVIKSYSEVKKHLSGKMLRKFEIFEKLEKGPLKIGPYGDYGWGMVPWGGGEEQHLELLKEIRRVLQRPSPEEPQKDRDARHLMHSAVYGCRFFLTMDYRLIHNFQSPSAKFKQFMETHKFSLAPIRPARFLNELNSLL